MTEVTLDSPLAGRKLLVGVSGSIAAYKAADLCSRLGKLGADVHVGAEFAKPAAQVGRLVGGDAAGNADKEFATRKRRIKRHFRHRRFLCRSAMTMHRRTSTAASTASLTTT